MRPHQWVKNLFVLAPVVFAQELDDLNRVAGAVAGFASFSLLASADLRRRMGEAGRRRMEEKFDLRKQAERLEEIYSETISGFKR